ncbi:MAG: HPr(Ser) kinase/phosphatase [Lachnospiraceae bacterium]|nr:HPr(Ser) kinase/phosphatase [Lachnospiraceae bacterium]
MEGISLSQVAMDMNLRHLNPEVDIDGIRVTHWDVNRPALQMAGFFEHFDADRMQFIGNMEMAFLRTLTRERKNEVFRMLFSRNIPCLVYCRDHLPDEEVIGLADEYEVPLFASHCFTSDVYARVLRYLQEKLGPTQTIHGVLMDVAGVGILITGESGIGKSEAALELIKRGHRLVADDAVELHRINDAEIVGRAPEVTKHFIELRGIGIIDVKALFGAESVKDEQDVDMVIVLEDWNKDKTYDRLGSQEEYVKYLGNKILSCRIPIRPGRNVAIIVEAAAVNFRQKEMGYDAKEELYKRVQNNMLKGIES